MDEVSLLHAAMAEVWPDVERQLGGAELAELESAVLIGLRLVEGLEEAGADAEAAVDAVVSAFGPYPAIRQRLENELELQALLGERDGASHGERGSRASLRSLRFRVFYATNRLAGKGARYGGERGALSRGGVLVGVPDDHRLGEYEKPRHWRLGFSGRADQSLSLDRATPIDEFSERLAKEIAEADKPEVLIFIHGYNVDFTGALSRTAQLAYDIGFPGVPVLFSWPSRGKMKAYIEDGGNAEFSARDFSVFLMEVLGTTGVEKVHIIAHSMGNRVLIQALRDLDPSLLPEGGGRLGEVVFAAPDVDTQAFAQTAPHFVGKAERFTLYVSAKDKALAGSATLARYARAGQAGVDVVVVNGVDTVDASQLRTGIMSHSYIGDNRALLSDLHSLIRNGLAVEDRFGLKARYHVNGSYWFFDPDRR